MKALCITGADNSTLEAIAAPFYKAGMQPPKSLKREKEVSFARWHQQVGDTLAKKQPIGKLWENLASDLLLVNLESELWGWYEEQSVKALDFWADLEPSIHFLLVCTRPEDELCQKISQTEGSVDAEAFIKEWHQRHKKLLQFYLKHPQRCLLIDAQDALQHLNKQLLLAHDHWQLPLDQETAEQQVETPAESAQAQENAQEQTSGIVSLVAREALKKVSIDITDFYTELRAAQYPLNGLEESEATTRKLFDWLREDIDLTALNQLLTEYRALQQQATLASKLPMLENQSQNIRQQLEEAEEDNKLQLMQLQQVKEELQYYFQKNQVLQAELEEVTKQKEDALHQNHLNFVAKEDALHQNYLNVEAKKTAELQVEEMRLQLEEDKQENELLLLQLHQVQEELESYFVQNQNLNKKQEELQAKLQDTAKQKEDALHQNHLNAEAKKDALHQNHLNAEARKAAEQKVKETTQQLEESKQENELLLLQLHQVQEELESHFVQNQNLNKKQEELQAKLQETAKQKEDALRQNHLNAESRKTAELKVKKTTQQLEESKQENKRLLLQLHQVQKEVESHFLQNQELSKKQEELNTALEDALHQNHLNAEAKKTAQGKVLEISQEYESLLKELHQTQVSLEKSTQENHQLNHTTLQLDDSKQENKLLLLQLHQVQKEVESHFLQNQELSKKQEELNTALEDALHQNQLNAVAKQDALHQNHLNAEAKKAAQGQVAAITQEYESLLRELHQTQVNLEKSIQENHQLSRMVKQLQAANEQYKQSWAGRLVKAPATEKELVYQDLELTHEQVNSDYEHLLINLKNPAFGAATASQWSFCLSCAAVKPGAFGQQPKLELPEQKEQLLHKWFEESVSEHGPKLELRFALPGSMDTSVWKQIEQHDQKLIRSLIEQLPQILGELKQKGTPISRSWEDWERLASDMNRIHQSKVSK